MHQIDGFSFRRATRDATILGNLRSSDEGIGSIVSFKEDDLFLEGGNRSLILVDEGCYFILHRFDKNFDIFLVVDEDFLQIIGRPHFV